jgi:hypothetical protein
MLSTAYQQVLAFFEYAARMTPFPAVSTYVEICPTVLVVPATQLRLGSAALKDVVLRPEYDWLFCVQVGLCGPVIGTTGHTQERRDGDGEQNGQDQQDHHELDEGETGIHTGIHRSVAPLVETLDDG